MKEIIYSCDQCGKRLSGPGVSTSHIVMNVAYNSGLAIPSNALSEDVDKMTVIPFFSSGSKHHSFDDNFVLLEICSMACLTKYFDAKYSKAVLQQIKS